MSIDTSVTEAQTTEAPQETPAAASTPAVAAAPKESNSATIAAIAREKKQALIEKRKLQAEREAIAKDREEITKWRQQMAEAKNNPIAALQASGYSYKDATDFVLNNSSMTAEQQIKAVQDEIKALKDSQETKDKSFKEEQAKAAEQQVKETIEAFKSEVNDFLAANQEEYELIHFTENQELVFSTIEEHFSRTKKVLSIKEASDLVEKYLEDQTHKAITETKKMKSKFQLAQEQKVDPGSASTSKTLSNSATISSSAPSTLPAKTEQDRMRRALAALGGM